MKLKITIRLGNDAMLTGSDVIRALIRMTNDIQRTLGEVPSTQDEGSIRDANGQTVGHWRFMRSRNGEKL